MLDMGFIHDIRKVVTMLSQERQNLFFSATMSDEESDLHAIEKLMRVKILEGEQSILEKLLPFAKGNDRERNA